MILLLLKIHLVAALSLTRTRSTLDCIDPSRATIQFAKCIFLLSSSIFYTSFLPTSIYMHAAHDVFEVMCWRTHMVLLFVLTRLWKLMTEKGKRNSSMENPTTFSPKTMLKPLK
jgi:hypothetical protein